MEELLILYGFLKMLSGKEIWVWTESHLSISMKNRIWQYLLVKRVLILVIKTSAVSASLHQDHSHLVEISDKDVILDHVE